MLQVPSEPTLVPSQPYCVDFPLYAQNVPCPVQGCPYPAPTRYKLRRHFCIMHPSDVIIVVEEGEFPRCPHCKMFVKSVGPQHFASTFCRTQAARILEREQLGRQAMEACKLVFYVDEVPIDTVTEFKYLGRILSADDRDDATVSFNIKKANQAWWGMYPILRRDGANAHTMAHFYLAVVQAKLLFGSETWVLTKRTLERLERFHARCARCIAHRPIRRLSDGSWECPHTNEVLDCCGLSSIATYIAKRKTRLLDRYAEPHSTLYQQCIMSTPVGSGARHQMWWN